MPDPDQNAEAEALIQGYVEGNLTPEESARLRDLIRKDPLLARVVVESLRTDGAIREIVGEKEVAPAGVPPPPLPTASGPPHHKSSRRIRILRLKGQGRPGSERTALAIVAAIAAAFLILIIGVSLDRPSTPKNGRSVERELERVAEARRRKAEEDHLRAQEARRRAEDQLSALEKRREELLRATPQAAPDPVVEESRKSEIAKIDSEKVRIDREMRQAIDRNREAQAELTRLPEKLPDPPKVEEIPPAVVVAPTLASVIRVEPVGGEVLVLSDGKKTSLKGTHDLLPGQAVETAPGTGRAVMSFMDKTRVDLSPGTAVREARTEGGKRLFVERGTVKADVAKQPPGQPMVFATPSGEATVRGTTLRIIVDPDPLKGTRLEVTEGLVEFKSRLDGKLVDVPSGHFALAASGVELTRKPLPIDEIVILPLPGRVRLVGTDWKPVKDGTAAGGWALEAIELLDMKDTANRRAKGQLGYAEFTFMADQNKDYYVWVRGRSLNRDYRHDAVGLEVPEGQFQGPNLPPVNTPISYWFGGWFRRAGYWWIGGDGDCYDGSTFYADEAGGKARPRDLVPCKVRFSRPGPYTLKLHPEETPMRIDAIWLTTTQKDRPEATLKGPAK